jgi:alkanesulfonate monooxygenase SsuD/methylene tetrahydromethanopterin reductase-like flavin-dependent oxidoreductase (luciferase family)
VKLGVTMPSRTAALPRIPEYAQMADEAGFDSVWTYELYRNLFAMLCASAVTTSQSELCTGLATAFNRSPFEAANAAAYVDEWSGGRMKLGLGTGVPEFLGAFHSTNFKKPLGRITEYIEVMRRSWAYLAGERVQEFAGEHYQFAPPRVNPWGLREMPRPQIPILLAGMRPRILQLCGAKADGWIGYLYTPKFFERVVLPNVHQGARSAGRDPDELDLACEVICCVHPNRDVALARAKKHVGFYLAHSLSDLVAEIEGVQDQVNDLKVSMMQRGISAFEDTPEELVELFSITGTPEECRQKLDLYKDLPHVALHTSYTPPFDAAESDDCYTQIIDTFKH